MAKRYWLMKSEPNVYSIADLQCDGRTYWDGIRNYQARNFMRDDMQVGDEIFFYHSNAQPMGIYGVAKVVREAYPDHTAFDPSDKHFDPKSDPANPTWMMVDVGYVGAFKEPITLATLKQTPKLEKMLVRCDTQPTPPARYQSL